MKRSVDESVGLYCLAAWKSHGLSPYATYRAWQADPGNEKHLGFAQRLYSRLIAEGLATTRSDLLYAPDKERHAFIVQSMQAVATQDPKTFAILLRDAATEPAVETNPEPMA